jgi:hypothetical protein
MIPALGQPAMMVKQTESPPAPNPDPGERMDDPRRTGRGQWKPGMGEMERSESSFRAGNNF